MEPKLELLVGSGIGGQRQVIEAAQKAGVPVRSAGNRAWPRDHYVFLNGKYKLATSVSDGFFGEGGYFRVGEGYLLMGTGIGDLVTPYTMADFLGHNGLESKEQSRQALLTKTQQVYPDVRIHLVPTSTSSLYGHNHLDMSVLLVPSAKLLVVDTKFGKLASDRREIEEIAEKEGLELIRYDGGQDGVWYPLNSAVFPREKGDLVFIDSKSVSLKRLLEERGVQVAEVEMPQHEYPSGKINCMTNVCDLGRELTEILHNI